MRVRVRAMLEIEQLAALRPRREAQWERLHADDYFEYHFGYYSDTKLETLKHFAPLRRRQKRDGLAHRFPGAGSSFDKTLADLARYGYQIIPCELCGAPDRDFCACYCEDCGMVAGSVGCACP